MIKVEVEMNGRLFTVNVPITDPMRISTEMKYIGESIISTYKELQGSKKISDLIYYEVEVKELK